MVKNIATWSTGATMGINVAMHVFLLLCALTGLFFLFISKVEKKKIEGELSDMINENVTKLLQKLEKSDKKKVIDWKEIKNVAKKIRKKYDHTLPIVNKRNKKLVITAISMIVGLLVLIIVAILFFKYYMKLHIPVLELIRDNLVTLAVIGALEIFFFLSIAFKYIPVTEDFVVSTLVERLKYNIDKLF
jgi:hypothetical protein